MNKSVKYQVFFITGIIIVFFQDVIYMSTPMLKEGPLVLGGIFSFFGGLGMLFNEFFKK